jgi:aspartate kinase
MIVVQKYGGSSVADAEKLGRVADKVVATKKSGCDVVVVVSAMGKTTDSLLALARSVALSSPPSGSSAGAAGPQASFEPPRRELDMLLSTGERVTMALLSIAIQARGFEAISFTGSQSGIITNDRHFDARIIEVRPHRIEDELARGKIVIVAGYQGMSYKREITTLGRGGSDTTAVALAAALEADRCEIYSDVDGVYAADPRVVPDPAHLPVLDLEMLQEMAESGAKVVCAQAVEWARRAKIALYARKTSDPLDANGDPPRQTVAREAAETHARAVVGMDEVALVHADARPERFGEVLAALDLNVVDLVATGASSSCVLPLLNVPDWNTRRARLEKDLSARIQSPLAMISVVGQGLTGPALPKFFAALRDIPVAHATAGPLRLSAVIPREHLAPLQRALYSAFIP